MQAEDRADINRRNYWAQRMDQAYDFMQRASDVPVHECGEKLVYLPQVTEEAGVEVTFSKKPHVENLPRLYYLREGLIEGFLKVVEAMSACGWILHIEDAYRTVEMQKLLARQPYIFDIVLQRCRWEFDAPSVPEQLVVKRLAALIASWPKVGTHMSGSALDVSVYDRADAKQIDRGADYLELSELTPMDSPFVSDTARHHREEITRIFAHQGFVAYPFEFWHYNSGDVYDAIINNHDARYGAIDWDDKTNSVKPLADVYTPLNSAQDLGEMQTGR